MIQTLKPKSTQKNHRGFLDTRLLFGAFSLFIILIIIFTFSRAYGLIQGPSIVLTDASPVSATQDGFVTLEGTVYRSAHFSINGRSVAPEQNGNFRERLLLTPGHTIMTLQARDRFDRTTQIIIPIYIPEYASKETNNEKDNSKEGVEGS